LVLCTIREPESAISFGRLLINRQHLFG
jgi:hypothetical protein